MSCLWYWKSSLCSRKTSIPPIHPTVQETSFPLKNSPVILETKWLFTCLEVGCMFSSIPQWASAAGAGWPRWGMWHRSHPCHPHPSCRRGDTELFVFSRLTGKVVFVCLTGQGQFTVQLLRGKDLLIWEHSYYSCR